MLTLVNMRDMIPFVNTCKHRFVTYIILNYGKAWLLL